MGLNLTIVERDGSGFIVSLSTDPNLAGGKATRLRTIHQAVAAGIVGDRKTGRADIAVVSSNGEIGRIVSFEKN